MSILSSLGLGSGKKIRYAFVALGDIAQEAMLPGVKHTGNSEVTAFVTGDPVKAREVGERYGVADTYGYDGFGEMLRSGKVDAIYLSTPNWRHAEFVLPALEAGIHVLVEKPLEVTAAKCREIVEAQKRSGAKLMVAYRLHFEPATLDAIRRIRAGELGELVFFSAAFSQMVDPENHRTQHGDLAGPVLDMGPYPVNAARYLFGDEPTEVVSAVGTRHPALGLGDLIDTVAVTLRFPGGKLAQFTVSYAANRLDSAIVAGTEGSLQLNPAFMFGVPLEQRRILGEEREQESFKATDQFGGELKYFSDCILENRDPEPDAEEGYADMRVLEAVLEAMHSGRPQALEPFSRTRRIDPEAQLQTLSAVSPPELVNASNPGRDK